MSLTSTNKEVEPSPPLTCKDTSAISSSSITAEKSHYHERTPSRCRSPLELIGKSEKGVYITTEYDYFYKISVDESVLKSRDKTPKRGTKSRVSSPGAGKNRTTTSSSTLPLVTKSSEESSKAQQLLYKKEAVMKSKSVDLNPTPSSIEDEEGQAVREEPETNHSKEDLLLCIRDYLATSQKDILDKPQKFRRPVQAGIGGIVLKSEPVMEFKQQNKDILRKVKEKKSVASLSKKSNVPKNLATDSRHRILHFAPVDHWLKDKI